VRRILIVFAREPIPGATKTRLCPPLDPAAAAALYACFLGDVLALASGLPGVEPVIAYTPATAGPFFARVAPEIAAFPQQGADLGARMDLALARFLAAEREHGGEPPVAVLIGSDFPSLPPAYLLAAFARLEAGADAVFGPADDGGYYLVGLREPQPRLLREVPMSTPTVLADTLALAEKQSLRVALLPGWYDIDSAEDLRRLAAELRDAPPEVAPRTRAFLERGEL
jgi:uncharacterized protein